MQVVAIMTPAIDKAAWGEVWLLGAYSFSIPTFSLYSHDEDRRCSMKKHMVEQIDLI